MKLVVRDKLSPNIAREGSGQRKCARVQGRMNEGAALARQAARADGPLIKLDVIHGLRRGDAAAVLSFKSPQRVPVLIRFSAEPVPKK